MRTFCPVLPLFFALPRSASSPLPAWRADLGRPWGKCSLWEGALALSDSKWLSLFVFLVVCFLLGSPRAGRRRGTLREGGGGAAQRGQAERFNATQKPAEITREGGPRDKVGVCGTLFPWSQTPRRCRWARAHLTGSVITECVFVLTKPKGPGVTF